MPSTDKDIEQWKNEYACSTCGRRYSSWGHKELDTIEQLTLSLLQEGTSSLKICLALPIKIEYMKTA